MGVDFNQQRHHCGISVRLLRDDREFSPPSSPEEYRRSSPGREPLPGNSIVITLIWRHRQSWSDEPWSWVGILESGVPWRSSRVTFLARVPVKTWSRARLRSVRTACILQSARKLYYNISLHTWSGLPTTRHLVSSQGRKLSWKCFPR